MIGLLLVCALVHKAALADPKTDWRPAFVVETSEERPSKNARLILSNEGPPSWSICAEDDLQELIGLADGLTGLTSDEGAGQGVLAIYRSPSRVLRDEADAIDAKDVKILRLRELIVKCRRPEKKGE